MGINIFPVSYPLFPIPYALSPCACISSIHIYIYIYVYICPLPIALGGSQGVPGQVAGLAHLWVPEGPALFQ